MLVPKISEPKQDIVILFALPLLQNFYSQTSCSLTLCNDPQVFLCNLESNFPKKKLELPSAFHTAISVCLLAAMLHVMVWCNYWLSTVILQSNLDLKHNLFLSLTLLLWHRMH